MTARNTASTSLLRDAVTAELRAARHAATKKPARLAGAVAAAAAVGAIAASAAAAPWAGASSSAPASRAELTSRHLAARSAGASTGTASAHATAGHAAPAHEAITKSATATHAASKSAGPSVIYDSVTPSTIPAGKAAAVYANGTYQASTAQVAGHKHVMWIDTNGSRTDANALDVEPGDATPAGAAAWVKAKLTKDPHSTAVVYTFKSNWAPVISTINSLPKSMQSHVKYWIADPTGTPHILKGAAATQWYWGANYDVSSAHPGFTS